MIERQIASLENKFQQGNYYDILQSYKALYFRNSAAKKFKETVALLMSGATNFLKYEQWNCAAECAQLLVDTYKNFKTQYNDESKENIVKIFKGFGETECAAKTNFMRDAIKWSAENGAEKKGSPEFHTLLANSLAREGDYIDAQKHYIFGDDPIAFASMLKTWAEDSPNKSDADLYIVRAVLGYLCTGKLNDATTLFKSFTSQVTIDSPLINFTNFLLMTLTRDALPLFKTLRAKYAPSIGRDPDFSKYLDQIAFVFYKVPLPQSGGLGSLLSGLFGGGGGGMFGGGGNSSAGRSNEDTMDTATDDAD
ncbi:DUF410 family protein [Cavenderia fasciculata]|uniref:DUF410 family protein n=1 Tax=Cavenderia fasciculata TaxID=261658 RepID=F4PTG3_CACFS|nr:DUF410 family protein [Cavenderia fasciculata]EGG21685.1 DUF410 family protein [Cavenderia fasciculata]|eukprot:XP_004359535.1 DUF410 family protein [Cavenderia fasciculata]